jgi:hypothetical protein
MEKISFLLAVTEVMKAMVSRDTMLVCLQRSGMRSAEENRTLLLESEGLLDEIISSLTGIDRICVSDDDMMDALVLRYLNNMQFLSEIEEDRIDISGLDDDLGFWKKTMLFKVPKDYRPKKKRSKKTSSRR